MGGALRGHLPRTDRKPTPENIVFVSNVFCLHWLCHTRQRINRSFDEFSDPRLAYSRSSADHGPPELIFRPKEFEFRELIPEEFQS